MIEANLKACLVPNEASGEAFNVAYGGREYLIDIYYDLMYDVCIAVVAFKAFKKIKGLDIFGLLKEMHVVFDVKCTLDRIIVDGRF